MSAHPPDRWDSEETGAGPPPEDPTIQYAPNERQRLLADAAAREAPPRRIGPWTLGERIGQGGMARVYRARDASGREAAIKIMTPVGPGDDPEGVLRFAREVEALAKLSHHEGIVTIESAGQTDSGLPYLVMELVEGPSLREALKRGLAERVALDHLEQVAEALAHAHRQGIVHRDVKPANVLLAPSGARLADFGLARLVRSQRLTRTGDVLGTPAYMAPEQASPNLGAVGPWTDVWALGVILHEILVGRTPYRGSSYDIMAQLAGGHPIEAPSSSRADIEPGLETLALRALSPRVADRLASAGEFLSELRRVRTQVRPLQARKLPLWLLGVAVVAGAVLGGVGVAALDDLRRGGQDALESSALVSELKAIYARGEDEVFLRRVEELSDALTAAERERVGTWERQARQRLLKPHWETRDVLAARALLRPEDPPTPRAWILALCGELTAALEIREAWEPHERAWLAAWAGDTQGLERALGELAPSRQRAQRYLISLDVPGFAALAEDPPQGRADGWVALGRSAWAERVGNPALAEAHLQAAGEGASGDLALEVCLGRIRLSLARGDSELASELTEGLELAERPLARARVLAAATLAELQRGAPLELGLGEASAVVARREAPGVPPVRAALQAVDGEDPAGWVGLNGARLMARTEGQAAGLEALGASGESFVLAELERCARGDDGLAGRWISRGFEMATAAEGGGHRALARRAEALLAAAVKLRSNSPAAWLGLARSLRVLHSDRALAAAEKGLELAGDDPEASLELARARLGQAEALLMRWGERFAAGEAEEPDSALLASLSRAAEAFTRGFGGASEERARLGAAWARAWRYRLLTWAGESAGDDLAAMNDALAPLLEGAPLADIDAARTHLARALAAGDAAAVRAGELVMAGHLSRLTPGTAAALRVGALGRSGPRRARCFLALADLTARSALAVRRAELRSGHGDLAHARALDPLAPLLLLHQVDRRLKHEGAEALETTPVLAALAQASIRDPDQLGLALDAAAQTRAAASEELATQFSDPDALALAEALLQVAPAASAVSGVAGSATPAEARLGLQAARELLARRPDWVSSRLLLAAASAGVGARAEALHQLRLVEAADPWLSLPLLWRLRLQPESPDAFGALVGMGYLQLERRGVRGSWPAEVPQPALLSRELRGDDEALTATATALLGQDQGWALGLTALDDLLVRDRLIGELNFSDPAGLSPLASPRMRQSVLARLALSGLEEGLQPVVALRQGWLAALRADLVATPAGAGDDLQPQVDLQLSGFFPREASSPRRVYLTDQPRLRSAWLRQNRPGRSRATQGVAWALLAEAQGKAWVDPLSEEGLAEPWGLGTSILQAPLEFWSLCALHHRRLETQEGPELLLALDRAAASGGAFLPHVLAAWSGGRVRIRAYNEEDGQARRSLLTLLDTWLESLVPLTTEAERPTVAGLGLDVALDGMGFAPKRRATWRPRVERWLAEDRPGEVAYEANQTLAEAWWRRARAHATLGDVEAALKDVRRVEANLSEDGRNGVVWAMFGDPLLSDLVQIPEIARLVLRVTGD